MKARKQRLTSKHALFARPHVRRWSEVPDPTLHEREIARVDRADPHRRRMSCGPFSRGFIGIDVARARNGVAMLRSRMASVVVKSAISVR